MRHYNFQAHDPFRPLNWRLRRASTIAAAPTRGRAATRDDDLLVRAYARYLASLPHPARFNRRRFTKPTYATKHDPGLVLAHSIHCEHDDAFEAVLQACLLAGLMDDEIAAECQTSPAAVRWYADLFYDVRPHLRRRTYIRQNALLPAIRQMRANSRDELVSDATHHAALRMVAYVGGPHALRYVLWGDGDAVRPSSRKAAAGWVADRFHDQVRIKGYEAIVAYGFSNSTAAELFRLASDVIAGVGDGGKGGGRGGDLEAAVEGFLEGVQIQIGAGAMEDASSQVRDVDSGPWEATSADYAHLAGATTPEAVRARAEVLTVFREFAGGEKPTQVVDSAQPVPERPIQSQETPVE